MRRRLSKTFVICQRAASFWKPPAGHYQDRRSYLLYWSNTFSYRSSEGDPGEILANLEEPSCLTPPKWTAANIGLKERITFCLTLIGLRSLPQRGGPSPLPGHSCGPPRLLSTRVILINKHRLLVNCPARRLPWGGTACWLAARQAVRLAACRRDIRTWKCWRSHFDASVLYVPSLVRGKVFYTGERTVFVNLVSFSMSSAWAPFFRAAQVSRWMSVCLGTVHAEWDSHAHILFLFQIDPKVAFPRRAHPKVRT